jgi:DNA primase
MNLNKSSLLGSVSVLETRRRKIHLFRSIGIAATAMFVIGSGAALAGAITLTGTVRDFNHTYPNFEGVIDGLVTGAGSAYPGGAAAAWGRSGGAGPAGAAPQGLTPSTCSDTNAASRPGAPRSHGAIGGRKLWTDTRPGPILGPMSLPPGFLDELRSRVSLSQVVGRRVVWDARKSNQAKGDLWAPCPFHQEKSPSFHVDDRKGYYYCFGCHAKGDAISFVRETENLGFMEAVELLAAEAGLAMPQRDPRDRERDDRRAQLTEVMEAAVRWFRRQLAGGGGAAARAYLDGRRLDEAVRGRWDIGFAPDDRRALWRHLTEAGVDGERLIDAGLAARPDDGGAPYDRFRGRIVFPIRDPRGRCIALGGRAMRSDARAKYLNSPETLLFDKSRTLYNLGPAREAAGKGAPLIVAEGYVDVIALVEAGFAATVAPLGTAITETQLQMLWRVCPEPIVALDGDRAGLEAGRRLMDLALPLMEAGQGLRFALMPPDTDPDDLIRDGGAAAMQARIDAALPMIDLLWQRETEGQTFDSPERRAALDRRFQDLAAAIKDPTLRHHYRQELRQRQWQLGRSAFVPTRRGKPRPTVASTAARQSMLASAVSPFDDDLREAVILAVLINHPEALAEVEDRLESLDMRHPDHAALRGAILDWRQHPGAELRAHVLGKCGAARVDKLFSRPHVALVAAVRHPAQADHAVACLEESFTKLAHSRGMAEEIGEARSAIAGYVDEERHAFREAGEEWSGVQTSLDYRLRLAGAAPAPAQRDAEEFDEADNGVRLDRTERKRFDDLLRDVRYAKSPESRSK